MKKKLDKSILGGKVEFWFPPDVDEKKQRKIIEHVEKGIIEGK